MSFPGFYAGDCNATKDVDSSDGGHPCRAQARLPAFSFGGIAVTDIQSKIQEMREKSPPPEFASLLDQFRLNMEVRRTIIARRQEQVDIARALISKSRRAIRRSQAKISKRDPMLTEGDRRNRGF